MSFPSAAGNLTERALNTRDVSSSPLKIGMWDPTTSANADLYFTAQYSIQNSSELQETQVTDMKGGMGQGKARSQEKKG